MFAPAHLIIAFITAASLCMLMIPIVIKFAKKYKIVDTPTARKVHEKPIPRLGGVAIFGSFALIAVIASIYNPTIVQQCINAPENFLFVLGAVIIFGLGLFDDFRPLSAKYKFTVQIFAACLAYIGGIRIDTIGLNGYFTVELEWLAPFVSIFWIILVVNAINLIDGLDGLAGGISLFAVLFLGAISYFSGRTDIALIMATLAGSILGFLKFNFNPASIFMGDGGSYFLGYMLATFSIMSAIDNHSAFTVLIPMLALGLPIIDVTMATVRRFIHGHGIFRPDKKHFHHMLLQRGLSHRNAVLVLYAVAALISLLAMLLMQMHDGKSLIIIAAGGLLACIGISKLGYFQDYDKSAILPWLNGISYEVGISKKRRSLFNLQTEIDGSKTISELWQNVEKALVMMEFVSCAVYLSEERTLRVVGKEPDIRNRRKLPAIFSTVTMRKAAPHWYWENADLYLDEHNRSLLRLEMEMFDDDHKSLGTIVMIKDQKLTPLGQYTLKRVEHLRRSIVKALVNIQQLEPKASSPAVYRKSDYCDEFFARRSEAKEA